MGSIEYNEIEARRIIEDLKYFAGELETIYYFPKREIVTYDYIAENKDNNKNISEDV